jgi:hypothetical protein
VIFLVAIVILTGCLDDPVQEDLLNYVNKEMTAAYELEKIAVTAYKSVTGVNYKDDQTMYDTLKKDVIPNYEKFIKELKSIKIESNELKEIHDIYIRGAETQSEAFAIIIKALENQDPALIQEANDMLDKGRKEIEDYQNKLDELADEHNVNIEKKNE